MATVKTQDGKVVLKGGKVSCVCCGCCMYPRVGIPYSYGFEDLPEKLNVDFPEGSGEWTLDRSQGVYCPSGSFVLGELGYGYAEVGDWVLWYPDPLGETYTSRPISPCLITGDGNLTPGDDVVEDQFQDTLTPDAGIHLLTGFLNLFNEERNVGAYVDIPATALIRSSLCCWTAEISVNFYWVDDDSLAATGNVTVSICYKAEMWHLVVAGTHVEEGSWYLNNYTGDPLVPVLKTPVGSYTNNDGWAYINYS